MDMEAGHLVAVGVAAIFTAGIGFFVGYTVNLWQMTGVRRENAALWKAVKAMKALAEKHPFPSKIDLCDVGYRAAIDELDKRYGKPGRNWLEEER